jgi:hypothetical protein
MRYLWSMKTVQEIRLANFRLLLAEAKTQAELARAADLKQPYINQLARGALQNGKPRSIGDEAARKFEAGMNKPVGWMDRDNSVAATLLSELNGLEGQLVTLYRQLDDEGKEELLGYANRLLTEHNPEPSPANPFGKGKKSVKA